MIEAGGDPYEVLGLERGAGAEELRRAYVRLVRIYPPETNPDEFKRVRAAYETLRSPLRRAELAVLAFDETAADIELDLVAQAGEADFDPAALLLVVERSVSDLARTDFSDDLSPIGEEELFGSVSAGADGAVGPDADHPSP